MTEFTKGYLIGFLAGVVCMIICATTHDYLENAEKKYDSTTVHITTQEDIKILARCNAICMLPGWKRSKGARLEYHIAKILNMQILEFQPEL